MENQMTIDEQLDRMNEADFKAFLEACITHKTKKTFEQEAMFSQLDRLAKTPEEALPPLTTTKHSSSLQSLSQSPGPNSRKNSQLHHNASSKSSSGTTSSSASGGSGPCPILGPTSSSSLPNNNNNTHHHLPHINSGFSSIHNYNSLNNTNCTSTSLSSTGSTGDDEPDPLSSCNSQNQQPVNCITTMVKNSHYHLFTPASSYYPSPSSSSHTEEDAATTIPNSSISSPNASYSTTTFTPTAPLSSRQYRYHSQSQPPNTPSSTRICTGPTSPPASSSISVNFNLKRPPAPKPTVHNHTDVTGIATMIRPPYFFNARTATQDDDDSARRPNQPEVIDADHLPKELKALLMTPLPVESIDGNGEKNITGSFQLRNEYSTAAQGQGIPLEFGASGGRTFRASPRSSRSGTPVHGENASASLTRRPGRSNKKPKETIWTTAENTFTGDPDRYQDNIDNLVSYITGETEKSTQSVKKPKKKAKRKETLSKSHSLDENTLGIEVNPSIETRSVSSNLLENKSDEKVSAKDTTATASLDLSTCSAQKLETLRSHPSSEFITVTNRKKNKGLKGDGAKSKSEAGQEDIVKSNPQPVRSSEPKSDRDSPDAETNRDRAVVKANSVPKPETVLKPEPLKSEPVLKPEPLKPEPVQESVKTEPVFKPDSTPPANEKGKEEKEVELIVTNKETFSPTVPDIMPVFKPQSVPVNSEPNPPCSTQKEPYVRQDYPRKQDLPIRRYPADSNQSYIRKYSEPCQRRHDGGNGGRRPEPSIRRQDQGRRKDVFTPSHDTMPRRPQFVRHDSEPRKFPSRHREPVSKSASLSSDSLPDSTPGKGEEPVKFCGVNFENNTDIMLHNPNVNVEFGFGVTDVLTQLAKAPSVEVSPNNSEDIAVESIQDHQASPVSTPTGQTMVPPHSAEEMQHPMRPVEYTPQPFKHPPPSGADASLLGRHPQSGNSPPVHFLPISVPLTIPGTAYQISGANYYPAMPQQVPVGVVQYYAAPPHMQMQPIQQISAPIMTAIPAQGTGTMPQHFMNPLQLTPQQQHQILQHQQLIQQQPHPQTAYNPIPQQQPQSIIQYPVILKSNPQQQLQYAGNQPQYVSGSQNTGPPQQGYNTSGGHGGGNYNYHRNSNTPRSNHHSQMTNYGMQLHQNQQQYGQGQGSQYHQNSSGHQSQNYNPPAHSAPVHYGNYHRNNSRSNHNVNSPGGGHSHGPQLSPQGNAGSGQSFGQSHRHGPNANHTQNPRSLGNPAHSAATPVSLVVNPPSPDQIQLLKEVAIFVNPQTNPLGDYYIDPAENEDHVKYGKSGQEYMNNYAAKVSERIERGATVHRVA